MIGILRQNKVHVAPIFEPTNRRYGEVSFFFKISEFQFTSDDEANNVNLNYLGRSAEVFLLFVVNLNFFKLCKKLHVIMLITIP